MIIVLGILKWIGIILLCMLGLILLAGCLVLFVPIRYTAEGEIPERAYDEPEDAWKKRMNVRVKVTWLLHALSVLIHLPDEHNLYVKIVGIRVIPTKEAYASLKPHREPFGRLKKVLKWIGNGVKGLSGKLFRTSSVAQTEIITEETKEEESAARVNDNPVQTSQKTDESHKTKAAGKTKSSSRSKTKSTSRRKTKASSDDRSVFEKLEDAVGKLTYTISGICDKIDMFDRIWNSYAFQEAFAFLKKRLIQLCRAILPRRFDASAHFGTGDPGTTANLLALYGILYPAHRGNLTVEPEFEEKVFDGHFFIRGRIFLFRILFLAGSCYFDKNVRVSLQRIRKLMHGGTRMKHAA